TIPAEKHFDMKRPPGNAPSPLDGIDENYPYVVIEYRVPGGRMRMHLTAFDESGERVALWFHLRDSNGIGRMFQCRTVEEARKEQERLQKLPPLSQEELRKLRAQLQAHYLYYPDNPGGD